MGVTLRDWAWRIVLFASGLAVAASYALPAMHRAGGGTFSTSEFLTNVQSGNKTAFLLGAVLACVACVAALLPRRLGGGLAIAAGALGIVVHLPAFGDMADTGREIAWPLLFASLCAAVLLANIQRLPERARRIVAGSACGLGLMAVVVAAIIGGIDHAVPNELGSFARREMNDGALLAIIFSALGSDGPEVMVGALYLLGLVAPLAASALGFFSSKSGVRIAAAVLALAAVQSVPWSWVVSSLSEDSRYHWDLLVRVRVALCWSAFIALLATGAHTVLVPEEVQPSPPDSR